jgi:polyribonucleotide nucleotidyltransferase
LKYKKVEKEIEGRLFSIESGRMANQADGSVLVRHGETMVLVTAVASQSIRKGIDFLPLTVDYLEMAYAAGKIPGGFYKREGKQSDREILISRLIDRPIRPLFPKGFYNEIQVIATVLSVDQETDPDVLAITGAAAALEISDIPFDGPIAGIRVGRVDKNLALHPTYSQIDESDINLIVVGGRQEVVMVEGGAHILPEDVLLEAIYTAVEGTQPILDLIDELKAEVGKPKRTFQVEEPDQELINRIKLLAEEDIRNALKEPKKHERGEKLSQITERVTNEVAQGDEGIEKSILGLLEKLGNEIGRSMIIKQGMRIDGRAFDEVRPVSCNVEVLPRTHGSGLFTRGETQVLAIATLGTASDEQRIDSLKEESITKSFILHYKFPPFSVGETKPLRGPSRRDVGHGALAERAILPVLPSTEKFPYTIRVVSEVLESNGSSSMATTCGTSISLMDAGVPIKAHVAGVAMGLIKEGDQVIILTDILGDEDHFGDMDFKVTGTALGITALQMDIKIKGVTKEIMGKALQQAREGRLFILKKMMECIKDPREELSAYAPRVVTIQIKPEKIKDVIGPGGRIIKSIVEETGAKVEVENDGSVLIASTNKEKIEKATEIIRKLTEEATVGEIYTGTVKKVMDFGAFVEIFPGTNGLVHISQLAPGHTNKVSDVVKEGDEVTVKVIDIDHTGKIRLSRKAALGSTQEKEGGEGQRSEHQRDRTQNKRERPSSSRFNDRKNSSR